MLKRPALARIHTHTRLRHSLIASLITLSTPAIHQRHERSAGRAAAGFTSPGIP